MAKQPLRASRGQQTQVEPAPVTTIMVPEAAKTEALAMADGDKTRLRTLPDGSMGVVNQGHLPWPTSARARVIRRPRKVTAANIERLSSWPADGEPGQFVPGGRYEVR